MLYKEKENDRRLPYLARSEEAYNKVLAIDPNNATAKNQINSIRSLEAQIRKGINPNEIRGVITDASTGRPISYASVRVKDTAAEVLTNSRGEFRYEIPSSSQALVISAEGYNTKEIPVTKSRVYNVSLEK